MSKIIETGSDSRAKLLNGVEQLAEAVVATLGPNGRNVTLCTYFENCPNVIKQLSYLGRQGNSTNSFTSRGTILP